MEITEMTIEQMEARKAEIREELEAEGADLDALETLTKYALRESFKPT